MPWRWNRGGDRQLVDVELGRPQVGMTMHDGRELADQRGHRRKRR